VEGNLESVLDEHLWLASRLQGLAGQSLAVELRDVLRLRSSVFFVHSEDGKDRFTLRCHAALPFTEARVVNRLPGEADEKPLRPDELRKAFNSPVLASCARDDLNWARRIGLPLLVQNSGTLGFGVRSCFS